MDFSKKVQQIIVREFPAFSLLLQEDQVGEIWSFADFLIGW